MCVGSHGVLQNTQSRTRIERIGKWHGSFSVFSLNVVYVYSIIFLLFLIMTIYNIDTCRLTWNKIVIFILLNQYERPIAYQTHTCISIPFMYFHMCYTHTQHTFNILKDHMCWKHRNTTCMYVLCETYVTFDMCLRYVEHMFYTVMLNICLIKHKLYIYILHLCLTYVFHIC